MIKVMKVFYRLFLGLLAVVGAAFFFKLLIGGNVLALFAPEGAIAAGQSTLIIDAVLVMLIIVVPVFVLLFTFAWKYREGNRNVHTVYEPEQTASIGKEIIMWAAPSVIVLVLGILGWNAAHRLDPYQPIASAAKPLDVQVVALQWKWLFIYPAQGIATVNYLVFPAGTPVHFDLTADAPMSSFWIPQLGSQIYAMSAMKTQLNLIASTTGDFVGKDTEINGAGYAGMTFVAKSVSGDDFNAWVHVVQQTTSTLDENSYNALALPSMNAPAAYYASVQPGLFNTVMMKFMGPSTTLQGDMHMY